MVSDGILSLLAQRLVVVTPELVEYSKSRLKDASTGLVRMVLKSLVFKNEIGRRPFLTSKNRIAYFYFLSKNWPMIDQYLSKLIDYLNRKKYATASSVARDLGLELKTAAYFLRHMAYLGELNMIMTGYIPQYGRCAFIYYVPGYREVVDKRHQLERQREYIEHGKMMFEFLAEQMTLEDKHSVIREACKVLRLCIKKGILRGRDLDKLAAGSFIFSLRKLKESVSVAEVHKRLQILDVGGISQKDMLSAEKVIAQELEIPLHHFPRHRRYIQRFVKHLELTNEEKNLLARKSLEVFSCIPRKFLLGKSPSTVAAATIYVASIILREKMKYDSPWITQSELSIVSGVTEVSIRNHYRAIEQFYKSSKRGEIR